MCDDGVHASYAAREHEQVERLWWLVQCLMSWGQPAAAKCWCGAVVYPCAAWHNTAQSSGSVQEAGGADKEDERKKTAGVARRKEGAGRAGVNREAEEGSAEWQKPRGTVGQAQHSGQEPWGRRLPRIRHKETRRSRRGQEQG